MRRKLKIVHIHSDCKFLNLSDPFGNDLFEHATVVLSPAAHPTHRLDKGMIHFTLPLKRRCYNSIIDICKNADLVMVYCLDYPKTRILLSLPANVKVGLANDNYLSTSATIRN